jgi:hypothetical protein
VPVFRAAEPAIEAVLERPQWNLKLRLGFLWPKEQGERLIITVLYRAEEGLYFDQSRTQPTYEQLQAEIDD